MQTSKTTVSFNLSRKLVNAFSRHSVSFSGKLDKGKQPDDQTLEHLWDKNSDSWFRAMQGGEDKFRQILDDAFFQLLGSVKGLKVLDGGCGEGRICREMAQRGANVTGVDISANLIHQAQKLERESSLGIAYVQDSCSTLQSIPGNTYDRVVSTMALMDMPNLESVLQSFYRVLKPGGELVFSIKHPFTTWSNVDLAFRNDGSLQANIPNAYFDRTSFSKKVQIDNEPGKPPIFIESIHFPRTISDYINTMKASGFEIVEMREPKPDEKACQETPYLKPYQFVPFALMIKARKPNAH